MPKQEDQPNSKTPLPPEARVGYAVLGIGKLTAQELLPAFRGSRFSSLRAVVSDDHDKALEFAEAHGLQESDVYSYDNFEALGDRADVQAVYIVLPNSKHLEFAERAARMGKHILCEKPLATTVEDAEKMVQVCAKANVRLMTAYRCQYTPQHWAARDLIQSGELGRIGLIEAVNTQVEDDPTVWRLKRDLAGGGALPDIGLYCLNTVRFLLAEEPVEVFAHQFTTPDDPRFLEVEEAVAWTMRFPRGTLATCSTSYNAARTNYLRVHGEHAWLSLDPAFAYQGLELEVVREKSREKQIMNERDQFALEIDHFSRCILDQQQPFSPGEEGLQDQRIMGAIYESAKTNKPVTLESFRSKDTFRGTPPERV